MFETVESLSQKLQSREITSEQLVMSCLKMIEEKNDELNAFVFVSKTAIEEAKIIDQKRTNGELLHPLSGIPIAIKDNIAVKGWEMTAGSKMLKGYVSPYDATVIKKLKSAGMILIGRTNMDEFAMGSSTETSIYGATKNPHDVKKIPGGSSGGSAACVASGMVPCALGSDTGGSIRQPASLCGVVGLKPTYGRVSRFGLFAMASSLDQIGPIAQTVSDCELIMNVIEGVDPNDSTSVDLSTISLEKKSEKKVIGIAKEYMDDRMDPHVSKCLFEKIEQAKSLGYEIKEISLPHTKYALAAYYVLCPSEVSSNMARFDGLRYGFLKKGNSLEETYELSRHDGFGSEVKRRIMLGSYMLSAGYYDAYYRKALKLRTLLLYDFQKAFEQVDVILTPTSPTMAWNIGEKFDDPITMYLSDIYTITVNLTGLPAISIPCQTTSLPIGFQLIAQSFDESTLYSVGFSLS